jgi:hypothetical protein
MNPVHGTPALTVLIAVALREGPLLFAVCPFAGSPRRAWPAVCSNATSTALGRREVTQILPFAAVRTFLFVSIQSGLVQRRNTLRTTTFRFKG